MCYYNLSTICVGVSTGTDTGGSETGGLISDSAMSMRRALGPNSRNPAPSPPLTPPPRRGEPSRGEDEVKGALVGSAVAEVVGAGWSSCLGSKPNLIIRLFKIRFFSCKKRNSY